MMNTSSAAATGPLKFRQVKPPGSGLSADFLRELAARFQTNAFVETGTYLGNTAAVAAEIFNQVHTIELSAELAQKARQRFADVTKVNVHAGDSAELLPRILEALSGPTLFWLDGHYSEGVTAKGKSNTPILDELAAIAASGRKDAVILIDDFRLFEREVSNAEPGSSVLGYPSATDVHRAVLAIDEAYQFIVYGDIALAFPGTAGGGVSDVLQAMTISRLFDGENLPIEEVMAAEGVIGAAKGEERQAILQLLQISESCERFGLGLHYRLWSALVQIAQGRTSDACRNFEALQTAGFHWRAEWYLAAALHLAGDIAGCRRVLGGLAPRVPAFAPAQTLLAGIGPDVPASVTPAAGSNDRPRLQPGCDAAAALQQLGLIRPGQPIRLHLGCGERHFDGYINIDYPPSEHTCQVRVAADVFGDITKLQFPTETVDEIRLHHVFEHFDRAVALGLLTVWQMWLKPGGRLVIETPDLQASLRMIADPAISYQRKQSVLRHVFGSHEANWAVHWDGWFEEKYRHVLPAFGYGDLQFEFGEWQMSRNITVSGRKVRSVGFAEARETARSLLSDSLILDSAESEQRLLQTWVDKFDQFAAAIGGGSDQAAGPAHQPLVSIFVPVFNGERYLAATLDSLLAQTYRRFEIIVADDGSADGTLRIAREYSDRDSRVRVMALPHAGEVAARNAAVAAANPESAYLLNHDSDDVSLPDKLATIVSFLETHPEIAIAGCLAEYFDDAGRSLGQPPIETSAERIRATFGEVNSMINSAAVIRRDVFGKLGGYREAFRSVDDYDFFARALLAGFALANVPRVLHRIRRHPHSIGSTRAQRQQELADVIRAAYRQGRVAAEPAPQGSGKAAKVRTGEQKLSILHTVEFYAPHVGGAELVVQQISERLVRRGHRVTIATTALPERTFCELNGVAIRGFKVRGKLADGLAGDIQEYGRFLADFRPDVMMNYAAQVWSTDIAFAAVDALRERQVNVIAPCGYSALVDEKTLRWPHYRDYFENVLPSVLPKYDAAVYHSGIYKDYLFGQALKLTNGVIIPNGTDEAEFTSPVRVDFRKKYQLTTRFVGLCVANFYPDKGQERVLECVRQMARSDFTMVFIGKEGPQLAMLQEQARGLKVRFIVAPPREDTVAAFRSSDLFLFGSHIEASPLVIIEAKAAHLPFVSTDCGNVREWKGGLVCAADEMAVTANALLNDAKRRQQLAEEGWKEWKQRLTWDAVTDQWEELYRRSHHCKLGGNKTSVSLSSERAMVAPSVVQPPSAAVVVKLQGGMGNQMFQYAAGLAVARRTGAALKLDLSFLLDRTPRANFTYRDYDLDLYCLADDCEVLKAVEPTAASRLVLHKEKAFHYDPAFAKLGANCYLDGYWQTPKYFENVAADIKQTFRSFRTPLTADAAKLAQEIRGRQSVCLNVRRADYISNPIANAFHGVCAESYYQQAVRYIRQRLPDAHFYIFSDDVEWCKTANLVNGAPNTVVSHDYKGDRFASYLKLMMTCRHFIIPNSSFAWWAAYLGQTSESIVIAPSPWFSELATEFSDIIPNGWALMARQPGPVPGNVDAAPTVSVVVPCYKQAYLLQEAVESVVAQTYADWEVIVVNDGSPDDTETVAKTIIAKHPDRRIRLLSKPNGGLSDARNAGIREARGQYILPLDADDRIGPAMLEKAVAVLESDRDVAIAYVDQQYFRGEAKKVNCAEYDFAQLCTANFFAYCSLFRKEAWNAVGGYNRNMVWGYEDWDFWVGCGEKGYFGRRVPDVLFYYRVKEGSMLASARQHDAELKSQIVLNHPSLYDEKTRAWAAQIGGTGGAQRGPAAATPAAVENVTQASPAPATAVPAPTAPAAPGRPIIALMSAYNEGDVIFHVIGDLIQNGLQVYLIDNCSTDNTVAEASKWLGQGLLKIERFPDDAAGYSQRCSKEYVWREILRRKEELSGQLNASWFLHVDADEFRESPWPGLTLAEAIRRVDELGYNAINFELLNFRPTNDSFVPGEDVRRYLPAYQPGELFDARQIKCWKNPGSPAQIVSNAGHSIAIPNRRVFPLSFILRHYPIRGETHGRRKVFQDRVPRFAPEEVAVKWHVQYNEYVDGKAKFLHRAEDLVPYDAAKVRADLLARFSQDVLLGNTLSGAPFVHAFDRKQLYAWVERRLGLQGPLTDEVGAQAEQVLGVFLLALDKKQTLPVDDIDAPLAQLLLALLEAKLVHARLTGDSHVAYLGTQLAQILSRVVTTGAAAPAADPAPAAAAASASAGSADAPLVSLCIPTYNGEEFIVETLRCALAQTFGSVEIIVSDDASSDRTVALAESVLQDAKVAWRILRHDRLGLVGNWNHCLAQARGRYVKFLFQDDYLEPDCIAELVALAERDPRVGLVFSPRRVECRGAKDDPAMAGALRDGVDVHRGWSRLEAIQPGTALLQDPKLLQNPVNKVGEPTTVLLRKAAVDQLGGFDANLQQLVDVEMWLRLMTRWHVGFVDRVLSAFRLHLKQATQANVRAGVIREDWKRFFGKLAHDPVFAALPEPHRQAARQQFLALGGTLPEPTAAQPASRGNAAEFERTVREAQELVRSLQLPQAAVLMEKAIDLAPTPEAAEKVRSILAELRAAPTTAEAPEAAAVDAADTPQNGDFFGPTELANIEKLLASYANTPGEAEGRTQLLELQRGLADFIRRADLPQLETLFTGDFGQVYRALLASGLQLETVTAADAVAPAVRANTGALAPADVVGLLADALLAPADRLNAPFAFASLPVWIVDAYVEYLLWTPGIFTALGDVERCTAYRLALLRAVHERIGQTPKDALTERVATIVAMKGNYIPLYCTATNTRELMEKRAAIQEYVLTRKGASLRAALPKRPKDRKKIKVGFLSAHFGPQTETHVTLPTLQLDRTKFEVGLFALRSDGTPIEQRCRSFADSFTVLPPDLEAQAKVIRDAALDILVIGTNITAVTNQVALLASYRLAPLQLVSYCSPMTTGFSAVDGYLIGSLSKFPRWEEQFSEELVVCQGAPGCLDYANEKPASTTFERANLGIGFDEVVFLNAASCYKITPEVQDTWAQILKAVPNSRLVLLPFNPNWSSKFPAYQFARTLHATLERHGLAQDRVILAKPLPSRADVKQLEKIADVYLDTFPFSGSLSVIDPLELGLPTLVCDGPTPRGRAAAALLRELEVTELIAADEAAYRKLAIRLGEDFAFREQLATKIRERMLRHPKFLDPAAYGRELSQVLARLVARPASAASARKPALACA